MALSQEGLTGDDNPSVNWGHISWDSAGVGVLLPSSHTWLLAGDLSFSPRDCLHRAAYNAAVRFPQRKREGGRTSPRHTFQILIPLFWKWHAIFYGVVPDQPGSVWESSARGYAFEEVELMGVILEAAYHITLQISSETRRIHARVKHGGGRREKPWVTLL